MRFILLLCLPIICGFSLPRGTEMQVIGEKFIQNGMRMDIYYFSHKDEPSKFIDTLHSLLEHEHGEVITQFLDDDALSVGLVTDSHFTNVTIQNNQSRGGTEGFFTRTNLKPVKVPDPPLDLSNSFTMVGHTYDPVGDKQTWVFSTNRDVVWVNNSMKHHGLTVVTKNLNGSTLMQGKVGRSKIQVSVTHTDEGTGVVIVK